MKKHLSIALVLVLADAGPGAADGAAVHPLRVAAADAVFVGKVADIADEGGGKVATVTVSADLLGRVGKKVTVGYLPPMGRRPGLTLSKGDEVLFFAAKQPGKKAAYAVEGYAGAIAAAGQRRLQERGGRGQGQRRPAGRPHEGPQEARTPASAPGRPSSWRRATARPARRARRRPCPPRRASSSWPVWPRPTGTTRGR